MIFRAEAAAREELAQMSYYQEPSDYSEEPYLISRALLEDGRDHLHFVNDQELLWGARDGHNEIWAIRGIVATAGPIHDAVIEAVQRVRGGE